MFSLSKNNLQQIATIIAASISGSIAVLSYIPNGWQLAAPAGLLLLFYLLWRHTSWRGAAGLGMTFGFAFFIAGLWWIYSALSGHIGLPVAGAALLLILFCAVLALFPAVAAAVAVLVTLPGGFTRLLTLAACWTLAEWLRSWLFSGFPWLSLGYSQNPDGWFAAWAPITGVFGITLALTVTLACLLALFSARRLPAVIIIAVLLAAAPLINNIWQWTTPAGTLKISLLQGNIKQSLKWEKDDVQQALGDYMRLADSSTGRVVIMPETALPMVIEHLPDGYVEKLRTIADERFGAVIIGVFEQEESSIYNSAIALQKNTTSSYRKVHLTPYGEYLPAAELLAPLLGAADIPYSGLTHGTNATPLSLPDGIESAIAICYEDIFGDEWRQQLPQSLFLTNITNDAWFDKTIMPYQHLQISQMRALETGRWLVRAANTGITAIVNEKGHIVSQLPQNIRGILTEEITLYRGATPYVILGDIIVVIIAAIIIFSGIAIRLHRIYFKPPPGPPSPSSADGKTGAQVS